jgi:hypothetical protein
MPIKWRGTSRRPIPETWRLIEQRSSPFHLAGNRNAAHPVNAILRRWEEDVWKQIISAARSEKPATVDYAFRGEMSKPARSRYGATRPAVLQLVQAVQ